MPPGWPQRVVSTGGLEHTSFPRSGLLLHGGNADVKNGAQGGHRDTLDQSQPLDSSLRGNKLQGAAGHTPGTRSLWVERAAQAEDDLAPTLSAELS